MRRHELATSAEIRAIFERASDLLERYYEEEDEDDDYEDNGDQRRAQRRSISYVIEAFRFCATAAGALRDPSLGDLVMEIIDRLKDFDHHADNHHHTANEALCELLQAGLPADKRIAALAKSDDVNLREAVAEGLDPRDKLGRALLESLAADQAAAVRKAAARSLASITEVPWWSGKWRSDPAARLLPGEAEEGAPALRRVSEILDRPHYEIFSEKKGMVAELIGELERLPGPLAVEAIEQFCLSTERYLRDQIAPLLLFMFEREGGLDAFERIVHALGSREHAHMHDSTLTSFVKAAPHATRLAICLRLAQVGAATPTVQRRKLAEHPGWLAAAVAGNAWPPSADITPMLDLVLKLGDEPEEEHEMDFVRSELVDAFQHEGVDPTPMLDRLCEARIAGFTGPWKGWGHRLEPLLARAPKEVLRRTAERALHSDDPLTLRWAMEQLLGPVFDAEKDGPALARVGTFLAEPRLRAALVQYETLIDRGLSMLRQDLRRGELAYPVAVKTVEGIGRLYGGLSDAMRISAEPPDAQKDAEKRLAVQAQLAEFLGPEELRGPPTQAEWEALWRARAEWEAKEGDENHIVRRVNMWARTLSGGAWSARERAELDAYFELLRGGELDIAFMLGRALTGKPDAEMLGHFDELIELSDADTRRLLKQYRNETRAALGLKPVVKKSSGSDDAGNGDEEGDDDDELPGGEWDDDDDDEEEDDDE